MKTTVNLLPPSCWRRHEHRRQARRWIAAWAALAGLLMVAHGALRWRGDEGARRVAERERQAAPVRQARADIARLHNASQVRRGAIERHVAMENAEAPLALLRVVAECRGAAHPGLRLEGVRASDVAAAAPRGAAARAGDVAEAPAKELLLLGVADEDAAVSRFVANLRASQAFATVELEGSKMVSDAQSAQRAFQIRCRQDGCR